MKKITLFFLIITFSFCNAFASNSWNKKKLSQIDALIAQYDKKLIVRQIIGEQNENYTIIKDNKLVPATTDLIDVDDSLINKYSIYYDMTQLLTSIENLENKLKRAPSDWKEKEKRAQIKRKQFLKKIKLRRLKEEQAERERKEQEQAERKRKEEKKAERIRQEEERIKKEKAEKKRQKEERRKKELAEKERPTNVELEKKYNTNGGIVFLKNGGNNNC